MPDPYTTNQIYVIYQHANYLLDVSVLSLWMILEDESLCEREKRARCNIHYDGAAFMLSNVGLSYVELCFVLS